MQKSGTRITAFMFHLFLYYIISIQKVKLYAPHSLIFIILTAFPPKPFLRPESEISPKDWSRGKWNPCSQNICFHFPSPHLQIRITTLVERGRKIEIKKNVERAISFNHLDLDRNSFELCPTYTAKIRVKHSRQKMRRREAPMIGLNSRQTQTPPRFSTLRVALHLPIQKQIW